MTLRSATARALTGVIAPAMLATSFTPAMADGYRGGGFGGFGEHHRGYATIVIAATTESGRAA